MEFKFANRMKGMGPSAIRAMMSRTQRPGVISFAGGLPAPDLFPIEELKKSCVNAIDNHGAMALQYGPTDGYDPLRSLLAERMKSVDINLEMENVVIVSGAQQGLDFTGKMFINEGDVVFVESPSYVGAINALKAYSPKIVEIPMDEDGMMIDELEKAFEEYPDVKLVYTIPDFQNPTGRTMSIERRKRLVELGVKYNTAIIEDAPYSELIFEGERMPAIKSFDTEGVVIYFGSISKILCPGLRIGWIAADAEVIKKYIYIKQRADIQVSSLTQRQIVDFCETNDLDNHVDKVCEYYKKKKNLMVDTMTKEFPEGIRYTNPKGGIFLWVTLPDGADATEILEKAFEKKVAFVPGEPFFPFGGHKNTFRLNYATATEENIVEGITRIGKILKNELSVVSS